MNHQDLRELSDELQRLVEEYRQAQEHLGNVTLRVVEIHHIINRLSAELGKL